MAKEITEQKKSISTNIFAHKGEVIVVINIPTSNLFLPPAAAREIASHLINAAEVAEQQMDEGQDR